MKYKTIIEALNTVKDEQRKGFTFIHQDNNQSFLSFAEIYQKALSISAGIRNLRINRAEPVGLILQNAEEFIPAFYGIILSGAIPVPIYPPIHHKRLNYYFEVVEYINKVTNLKAIITTSYLKPYIKVNTKIIDLAELTTKDKFIEDSITQDDIAFIQFTSGSISYPKGVMLTHKNISLNIDCFMGQRIKPKEDDIGISWLPLYHDMGLIGCVLAATYYKLPVVFMSPRYFLYQPKRWLLAITKYRGTISFSPNFGYGLCIHKVEDTSGLELGSWRIAGCAAEPISYQTLKSFGKKFEKVGFRESSFLTAYGLAEATLAVTFLSNNNGIIWDEVDAEYLYKHGKAIYSYNKNNSVKIVSCGQPLSSFELKIQDESGNSLPERVIGEVMVKGPCVMKGYYNNEKATNQIIKDGWLHTGDLGYLANNNLYICGRKKDLIIIAGKNYYPQDIEWVASEVEGVRKGNVVAFGIKDELKEKVVVVAESRNLREKKRIEAEIKTNVAKRIGVKVSHVEVVPPGTIPKTSSGKLQRLKTKKLWEEKKLKGGWYGKVLAKILRIWSTKRVKIS
jgi:fatty-acyl-CoA synthase